MSSGIDVISRAGSANSVLAFDRGHVRTTIHRVRASPMSTPANASSHAAVATAIRSSDYKTKNSTKNDQPTHTALNNRERDDHAARYRIPSFGLGIIPQPNHPINIGCQHNAGHRETSKNVGGKKSW